MADLREKLKALVKEWRTYPNTYIVADSCADQLAAILAEGEPKSLPLGHEFKQNVWGDNVCAYLDGRVPARACGQPRSAHEHKGLRGSKYLRLSPMAKCVRCGKECVEAGIENLQVCDRCLDV